MLRKIPARSILFLSLIQIGLLLLLLAWWGGFYQFLLPAAVLGQADWGTGAWLAAELLLILFVMNRFFEGEMFVMELTGGVKAALEDSGIDLTRAECYNLCTDGLGWGILYSDGKTELYQPLSEAPAFLEEGTAYTLEELADLVEEHAGELIRYEGLNADLDPEKPNVVTGAQPELSPQPEKENADTGR